jgi:hypothetical protein
VDDGEDAVDRIPGRDGDQILTTNPRMRLEERPERIGRRALREPSRGGDEDAERGESPRREASPYDSRQSTNQLPRSLPPRAAEPIVTCSETRRSVSTMFP